MWVANDGCLKDGRNLRVNFFSNALFEFRSGSGRVKKNSLPEWSHDGCSSLKCCCFWWQWGWRSWRPSPDWGKVHRIIGECVPLIKCHVRQRSACPDLFYFLTRVSALWNNNADEILRNEIMMVNFRALLNWVQMRGHFLFTLSVVTRHHGFFIFWLAWRNKSNQVLKLRGESWILCPLLVK